MKYYSVLTCTSKHTPPCSSESRIVDHWHRQAFYLLWHLQDHCTCSPLGQACLLAPCKNFSWCALFRLHLTNCTAFSRAPVLYLPASWTVWKTIFPSSHRSGNLQYFFNGTHHKRIISLSGFIFLLFSTRQLAKMSLYDGIEVETAPISSINISQAMEVDRESEKPPATAPQIVTTSNNNTATTSATTSNTSTSSECTHVH